MKFDDILRAAQDGVPEAQYELHNLLLAENKEQRAEAIEWLRKSADRGFAPAQYLYSSYCEFGVGMPADLEEAFRFCLLAASQGYCKAARGAASMYEHGDGVAANLEQAFYWYNKAAELGDADSASAVGRMYAEGVGVEQNNMKAMEWFLAGMERGSPWACFRLSSIFRSGDLGQRFDRAKADELGRQAVELIKGRVPKPGATALPKMNCDEPQYPLPPLDRDGKPVEVGARVRIVGVPDLSMMHDNVRAETEEVFQYLVGSYRRVSGFDAQGCAEIDFVIRNGKRRGFHFVAIEPYLVLVPRPRKNAVAER